MTRSKTQKLVISALLAAITYALTLAVQIPSPMQGYVNLGDCAVLLSAWLLGPLYGGFAAGIGSMLADILSGYAHYAPGTFVIKFAMAVAAAFIFRSLQYPRKHITALSLLASGAVAESIMVTGYFAYACLLLGNGWAAASSVPGNIIQGIFGLASAMAVYAALSRSKAFSLICIQ